MTLAVWISLVLASFIFAASPGPGNLALLATSTKFGTRAGLFMALGEVLGDLMYLGVAILSLGMLADYLAPAMHWVKIAGACYIIYIGFKQFTSKDAHEVRAVEAKSAVRHVLTGFLVCGTNPKVIVFYLSFLPLFIDLEHLTVMTGLETAATVGLTVFAALAMVSLMGGQLARAIKRPSVQRIMNKVTGGIMMGVGVSVARS